MEEKLLNNKKNGMGVLLALIMGVLVSLLTFFLYKRVEKLFFRKKHTA